MGNLPSYLLVTLETSISLTHFPQQLSSCDHLLRLFSQYSGAYPGISASTTVLAVDVTLLGSLVTSVNIIVFQVLQQCSTGYSVIRIRQKFSMEFGFHEGMMLRLTVRQQEKK